MNNHTLFNYCKQRTISLFYDSKLVFVIISIVFIACKKNSSSFESDTAIKKDSIVLVYNPDVSGIENNPLKGLVPYSNAADAPQFLTNMPFSMEYFYIPLSDVMLNLNQFDWTKLENRLNKIRNRNNHAVLRFYLDYPQNPIGTPNFLIQGGLQMRSYTHHGNTSSKAPDWNNSNLIGALENFIAAFGVKYDGDPRIGYIVIGLYGFWGEWHTYPENSWAMTDANRTRILVAFKNSFTKTFLHLRYPDAVSDKNLIANFGFNDDSYCYETLPMADWMTVSRMRRSNTEELWKQKPMGGEMRPELQSTILSSWNNSINGAQSLEDCNNAFRPTWLLFDYLFSTYYNPTQTQISNGLRLQKLMGYHLWVSKVVYYNYQNTLEIAVEVQNKGLAPLYYNFNTEFFALKEGSTILQKLGDANFNWHKVLPDNKAYRREIKFTHNLTKGNYALLMRIKNPLTDERPFRFANEKQDKSINGYLTLFDFQIK